MPRTDAEIKADLEATEHWLKEARERLWAEKANEPVRHDGESAEHFKQRVKRDKERLANREKVVKHLAKKKETLKERLEKREDEPDPDGDGLATYDGKTVAAHFVPWLEKIRGRGKWKGIVVSGWRSPAYSTSLCMAMCGAPSCPGLCAGAASNHAKYANGEGAIDVSDYYTFEAELAAVGAPYFNDLPIDPVHFSKNGH